MDFGVDDDEVVAQLAAHLVDDVPFRGGIRLCGVSCSSLEHGDAAVQLAFALADPSTRVASSTSRLGTARATSPRCAARSTSCAAATARARSATVAELGRDGLASSRGDARTRGDPPVTRRRRSDDARDARVSER